MESPIHTGSLMCPGRATSTGLQIELKSDNFTYRSVVGSLLRLAVKTFPNITVMASITKNHVEHPDRCTRWWQTEYSDTHVAVNKDSGH